VNRVTNRAVMERMKDMEVMNTRKSRKLEYLRHIMRNESKCRLLKSVLQGKVYGRIPPKRM